MHRGTLPPELPVPRVDAASLMSRARFFSALLAINVNGTTRLFFTLAQCGQWQIVQGVLLQLIVTTVDVILITCVLALYNRNCILVYSLGALFLAELASLCYILAVVTPRLTYNDECYVTSSPPVFQYFWCAPSFAIISLAFETVLFVLTIGKFIDAVRQGWGKGPVMQQFVANGTWLLVVLSFAGSRLILNPRRALTIHSSSGDITRSQLDIELSRLSRLSAPPRPRRAHGIAVTIERTTTTDNLEAHISLDCVPDSPWSATKGGTPTERESLGRSTPSACCLETGQEEVDQPTRQTAGVRSRSTYESEIFTFLLFSAAGNRRRCTLTERAKRARSGSSRSWH
ncbi:uncharacterized protein BXZ73DRAFT_78650 [Epithele typhae]|uniref:uncharacterized protein n=1 Tax=Epithele typhae TaxID=378194 RepID=UPI00200785F9|nr:uncharacterized protein BXZ73DRAFT_78650 [Epithele typhae]KAH9926540.1 hypothetical protein BXZ73DRAFT_78650 [Epithele typhae]